MALQIKPSRLQIVRDQSVDRWHTHRDHASSVVLATGLPS